MTDRIISDRDRIYSMPIDTAFDTHQRYSPFNIPDN